MTALILLIAVGATLAIFATTPPGRRVLKRIGLRDLVSDAAPSEDFDYLLSACGGDRAELDRRVSRRLIGTGPWPRGRATNAVASRAWTPLF